MQEEGYQKDPGLQGGFGEVRNPEFRSLLCFGEQVEWVPHTGGQLSLLD